ncbi:xanthine dehydrogenase family protein molybdopterin-binding subunit [Cupriavidus sp. 2SB]|uniref:xanthine dehydrogenase family protein molybdopterin-binding subunit n=1 Tax=Cupriavidus sp. 2SB TaxID=2502199 RepID=UPI0010F5C5F8|nr:xanthine dehydrogenase family protein molybdopterin-binding subunit [Cupriavidus sp. 2SB]
MHPPKIFAHRGLQNVGRRRFLLGAMAVGGGLVVGFHQVAVTSAHAAQAPTGDSPVINPFAGYVRIGADNKVTVIASQFESGQGIWHGIATLVQEELEADWNDIEVVGGYGNPSLYSNKVLGMQATGGSTGTTISFDRYRQAGAAARYMLIAAAASQWNVPASDIRVKKGVLSHASGKSGTFGSVAALAATLPPPSSVTLKSPKDWIYIGNESLRRYDTPPKVVGKHQFVIDVKAPGMLTAVMVHPPKFGAKVKSVDESAARRIKGFVQTVTISRGVAVVADHMWTALKARDLVKVTWDEAGAETRSSAELMTEYRALADKGGDTVAVSHGDVDAAFASAAKVIEATYEFPFLAHAPLEPLNAAVRRNPDGTIEVWGGHQYQDAYLALIAELVGVAPEKVILRVMRTGGSFGRRAVFDADVIFEAVSIAKAMNFRAPVKVQWTRENDMRAGQYRPMYLHKFKAGVDRNGKLMGWRDTIVGQALCKGTPFEAWIKDGVDPTTVEGSATMPYAVPARRVDVTSTEVGVPVTFWRSVGMNHSGYAVECFMDEVASMAGKDPLQFRLDLLSEHPRQAAALRLAAEKAGWGRPLPAGHAQGLSITETFGTVVAQVAEVSNENGSVKVHRVVCAIDCGIVVSPDQVRAQMEGGIGFGMGAALKSQITLEKGAVVQGNYGDYDVLRLHEMPRIEVHIIKSDAPPTGSGEPGVPGGGPAVANAWFALTRKPSRTLPILQNL